MERTLRAEEQEEKENREGSYASGALGAFLGSLLGAVVWALVLMMGYMAALVGLLIGWLSIKGYTLFHGKRGKAMILILLLALVFGVAAGTLAADYFTLVQMVHSGELPGFEYGEIPALMMLVMSEDREYLGQMGVNILCGLFFALLGCGGMLYSLARNNADAKIQDLP